MTQKRSVVNAWADVYDAVRGASNLTQPQAFWDAAEVYFVHCNDDVASATAGSSMTWNRDRHANERHST